MGRGRLRTLALLALILLAGCATPPWQAAPPSDQQVGTGGLEHYRFTGRIAIRQPEGSESARIQWQNDLTHQHITLLSPLGSTVAQLDRDPWGVDLRLSDREQFHARNSERLTKQVLGYALPLEGLPWWVLGQAAPEQPAQWRLDVRGQAQQLEQADWRIEYSQWRRVGHETLPGMLVLTHGMLSIKLKIDQWILGELPEADGASVTLPAATPGLAPAGSTSDPLPGDAFMSRGQAP